MRSQSLAGSPFWIWASSGSDGKVDVNDGWVSGRSVGSSGSDGEAGSVDEITIVGWLTVLDVGLACFDGKVDVNDGRISGRGVDSSGSDGEVASVDEITIVGWLTVLDVGLAGSSGSDGKVDVNDGRIVSGRRVDSSGSDGEAGSIDEMTIVG